MRSTLSRLVALAILCAVTVAAYRLELLENGRPLAFSLLAGAAFGIVMQRGRFCFLCNFRDFIDGRRSDGVVAILVALLAGVVFYQIVTAAWMPVPQPGRLPPNAHIGPVGWILAVAATIFGFGAALSGSCLSGHFYRLGEGAFGSVLAIVGAGVGFLLAFLSWNFLYTVSIFDDWPIWLPHHLGYGPALLIAGAVLIVLILLVLFFDKTVPASATAAPENRLQQAFRSVFIDRWPPVVTGVLVAAISAFSYFRVAPLGVTAELGSIVRTAGAAAGWVPETLAGLDTVRGCISAVKTTILSPNGLFVSGLIFASLASALSAGKFQPAWPSAGGLATRFAGGVLMGWGGMTALGCTIGVLLSGIHAGALSGWVFLVFCGLGAFAGLFLKRRFVLP
ncbi:membrane protein [Agrobacterium sp. TS43]|uniref:YeeE/YedE family protein n=1 Tax=Agrobacterium TaxID=357 RepID=UPI000370C1E3|nr:MULTISPECIES: YeeE/YedE family protein [Agrobacterium]EPR22658.1 membrane protein [Agrobacterium radiobacter DSM 30147]KDR89199.1 membrane protein [Agrobacterium tumefaciens GW4]KVK40641.1 membrane protein [Agrobacterium sp. JL28]KVK40984.1 membrane protein [Agrobacterium sp. LY4]KVK55249.1 membrane protein [Agrobacterium sp. TS45]